MANPKVSDESREQIAMVFQQYTVNPVEDRVTKALKTLEAKLVNPQTENCLEKALSDKADAITRSIAAVKKDASQHTNDLKDALGDTDFSIRELERKLVEPQTECLEKVLCDRADGISCSIAAVKKDTSQYAKDLQGALVNTDCSIQELERKLVNPETEECLETILLERADGICREIASAKREMEGQSGELQASIEHLEKRLLNPETEHTLEQVILSQLDTISNAVTGAVSSNQSNLEQTEKTLSAQITRAENTISKGFYDCEATVKISLNDLQTHLDGDLQSREKNVLDRVQAAEQKIVEELGHGAAEQHGRLKSDLLEALNTHHTQLTEEYQQLHSDQKDVIEQFKADILLTVSAEITKLEKMLRVAWGISGVAVIGTIATLIVFLTG